MATMPWWRPNEANNVYGSYITIGPDLVVASLMMPSNASAGMTISITDTTKNLGAGDAPASTTTYYLSINNDILDAADVALGSRAIPAFGSRCIRHRHGRRHYPARHAQTARSTSMRSRLGERSRGRPSKTTTPPPGASSACPEATAEKLVSETNFHPRENSSLTPVFRASLER